MKRLPPEPAGSRKGTGESEYQLRPISGQVHMHSMITPYYEADPPCHHSRAHPDGNYKPRGLPVDAR
jgi:hypothetical protein